MEIQELPYKYTVTLHRKKYTAYNNAIKYISSGFGALYRQRSVDKTVLNQNYHRIIHIIG